MTTCDPFGLQNCSFVAADQLDVARERLGLRVAVIARPDEFLARTEARQMLVETDRGVHTRCFVAEHQGLRFLVVYGRFGRVKGTAAEIDYLHTQEVLNGLGITHAVGTFSVGSIRADDTAGSVYVPHDLIGLGGFPHSAARGTPAGVRNIDAFLPFCPETREALVKAAADAPFPVHLQGVYACFHGWPRYETRAELDLYASWGVDIVGQTLDPEATLAREAGCHYAPIAATIDDHAVRQRLVDNDPAAGQDIRAHVAEGRRRTFALFLEALPALTQLAGAGCHCVAQAEHRAKVDWDFYYRPPHLRQPLDAQSD